MSLYDQIQRRKQMKAKAVGSLAEFMRLPLQGMSFDDAREYAGSLPPDSDGYSQRRKALLAWQGEQVRTVETVRRGLSIVYEYIARRYVVVDERNGGLREFVATGLDDAQDFARCLRPRRIGY